MASRQGNLTVRIALIAVLAGGGCAEQRGPEEGTSGVKGPGENALAATSDPTGSRSLTFVGPHRMTALTDGQPSGTVASDACLDQAGVRTDTRSSPGLNFTFSVAGHPKALKFAFGGACGRIPGNRGGMIVITQGDTALHMADVRISGAEAPKDSIAFVWTPPKGITDGPYALTVRVPAVPGASDGAGASGYDLILGDLEVTVDGAGTLKMLETSSAAR